VASSEKSTRMGVATYLILKHTEGYNLKQKHPGDSDKNTDKLTHIYISSIHCQFQFQFLHMKNYISLNSLIFTCMMIYLYLKQKAVFFSFK